MKFLLTQPCLPPWWAGSGHAQTILGHLLPSTSLPMAGQRKEISLPDGDRLVASYYPGKSRVVVLAFHGLAGESSADYMQRTAQVALLAGHSVYLVNHRGSGEGAGLAKLPYHSGSGADIAEAVAFARNASPGAQVIVVGFSISGSALLTLLTGVAQGALPDAAVCVNAPLELELCAQKLMRGWNRIYDKRFVKRLRRMLQDQNRLGIPNRQQKIPRRATLRDFDEIFTAPICGFGTRDNYYTTCSTQPVLSRISVPTILLTSEDDPFVAVQSYKTATLSPTTHLHIEPHGGHMGYLTRQGPMRWLDYALRESIQFLVK